MIAIRITNILLYTGERAPTVRPSVILLHKLRGDEIFLNHRLIESMEVSPDTILTLTNDRKYLVKEKPEEIIGLIQEFEREIFAGALRSQVDHKSSAD